MEELKKKLLEVADLRKQLEEVSNVIHAKREKFEVENSELFEKRDRVSTLLIGYETELREKAVESYNVHQIKKMVGGIGIRVTSKLEYDESVAFQWAQDHKLALKLDKKAFESIAKTQPFDFVKKVESISATIPTKIGGDIQ